MCTSKFGQIVGITVSLKNVMLITNKKKIHENFFIFTAILKAKPTIY